MNTPRKTTTLLILFSGFMLLSANLWAQSNPRPQQPPELPVSTQIVRMVDDLSTMLSLTKVQKTKISDLYFAHFEQVEEVLPQKPSREEMDKMKTKFEKQVMAVLNDKQKSEYAKFLKDHKRPGQQGPRR